LKGTLDQGDYVNTPILVEMKATAQPHFLEWARTCRAKTGSEEWVLVWKGDLRKSGTRPLMLVDLDFGLDLLEAWQGEREEGPRVPDLDIGVLQEGALRDLEAI
jgi:hypothetical protein